ncbi:hypothetical protein B0J14DRAFT_704039 [Halenospora varia]|nr:hypothetical protein B0J14DRAFT_704039 [Halenospora varia]
MCSYQVWEEVDELAFHENAIFLEACARSQAEESHSLRNIHQTNHLDLRWARDFLDDFALIAAGPGEASNVAAACLESNQTGEDFITIRVAKNEDFDSEARQRLSQIAQIMNQVRQRGMSIPVGQDLCFNLIATGCQPRILKQITGAKGLWSLVHQFGIDPIDPKTKVEDSYKVHRTEPGDIKRVGEHGSCRHEDSPQLAASRWKEMRQLIDRLHVASDFEAIKRLARLAYDVRRSDCLRVLLKTHCRQRHHSSKIVERLGKIAKFFRSAVSLIHVAASAAVRFKHIKVETVPSRSRSITLLHDHTVEKMEKRLPALARRPSSQVAEIQRLLRRWRKYIVHAEMLLLTFYEEHPQITLATNYIGISKRSCYLCANFIRIHGIFAVEGQHQQLYCLWTLPQEIKFGSQDRSANFTRALKDLQLLLAQRVTEVSLPLYRPLAFLKESVANFSRVTIVPRARSIETLNTVTEAEECITSTVSRPPLVKDEVDTRKPLAREHPDIQLSHQEKTSQETVHKESKQDTKTKVSSLPPTTLTVEESSCVDPAVLLVTQTPLAVAVIVQEPLLKDVRKKLPRAGKRRRRHRRRSERHNAIDRRSGRRKATRSATILQPDRRARRRKEAYIRSPNITSFVPTRTPVSRRRHSKRASRERPKHVTVGCLSVLLACLESAKRVVLMAFQGRR